MMRVHKLFSTQTLHTYSTLKRLVCALCIITGVLGSISNDSLRTSHNRITSREIIASKKKSSIVSLQWYRSFANCCLQVVYYWETCEKIAWHDNWPRNHYNHDCVKDILIYMYHGTVGKKMQKKKFHSGKFLKLFLLFVEKSIINGYLHSYIRGCFIS